MSVLEKGRERKTGKVTEREKNSRIKAMKRGNHSQKKKKRKNICVRDVHGYVPIEVNKLYIHIYFSSNIHGRKLKEEIVVNTLREDFILGYISVKYNYI